MFLPLLRRDLIPLVLLLFGYKKLLTYCKKQAATLQHDETQHGANGLLWKAFVVTLRAGRSS